MRAAVPQLPAHCPSHFASAGLRCLVIKRAPHLLLRAMAQQAAAAAAPLTEHFAIEARDGAARAGRLRLGENKQIETPGALIYTRRGSPVSLTPDMLERLRPLAQAVQINAIQFMYAPDAKVLKAFGKGGHRYLAMDGWPLIATQRDPVSFEYGVGASRNDAAYVTIHSGGAFVTPTEYMDVIEALAPDAYVTLADEIPADTGQKRATKAVQRTDAWGRECLQAAAQRGIRGLPLAAITGGTHLHLRTQSAQLAAKQPVAGFVITGLGTGESPEQAAAALSATLPHLPEAAPRLACSLGTPDAVLDAVAQGVDLFDTGYVAQCVDNGYALVFPVDAADAKAQAAAAAAAAAADGPSTSGSAADADGDDAANAMGAGDGRKLNLRSPAFRLDKRPLLPGCGCYACQHHSRAYIHHLLAVEEMLGEVLLEAHNAWHYGHFFAAVRAAVREGRFEEHRRWVQAQTRVED